MRRKRSQAKVAHDPADVRDRLLGTMRQLGEAFVDREDAIECIALALLTGENFLFVGDPGTAKTALVERAFAHVRDATHFGVLCGTFTQLDELVGPTDIEAFQAGMWARRTEGMLPDVDLAFLDEVMKANDGAVNSLLKVLNERVFEGRDIPLHCAGAATNWPEVRSRSEKVEALYDRFVLRLSVEQCKGESLERVLEAADAVDGYVPGSTFTKAELLVACAQARDVEVGPIVRKKIVEVAERRRKDGALISDRRVVKALKVVRARAWLSGRQSANIGDLAVLRFVFWANERDIAGILADVDGIDRGELRKAVERIDDVRQKWSQLKAKGRSERLSREPLLLKEMESVGGYVKDLVASGALTETSVAKVMQARDALKKDFAALQEQAQVDLLGQRVTETSVAKVMQARNALKKD